MNKIVLTVMFFQTFFILSLLEGVVMFRQDIINSDWSVAITPSGYVQGFFVLFISLLALVGVFIGYILAKKVKGRHMAIGSAVYWTVSFINLFLIYRYSYHHESLYQIPAIYTLSNLIWWSVFLVPFVNVAYIVRKYTLKHAYKMAKRKGEKQK